MQVVTFSERNLEEAAARLAEDVAEACAGRPYDAIIGIRRGGALVCDAFCRAFPASLYGSRHDVTSQRPGTRRKSGITGIILRHLPLKVLDMLRIAESRFLAFRKRHSAKKTLSQVAIDETLAKIMASLQEPRVLVIDDAIDSGDTLSAVIDTLKNKNRSAKVDTAVITVTTDNPCVNADFAIYRNRTLIRFPWSNDYKKTPKERLS